MAVTRCVVKKQTNREKKHGRVMSHFQLFCLVAHKYSTTPPEKRMQHLETVRRLLRNNGKEDKECYDSFLHVPLFSFTRVVLSTIYGPKRVLSVITQPVCRLLCRCSSSSYCSFKTIDFWRETRKTDPGGGGTKISERDHQLFLISNNDCPTLMQFASSGGTSHLSKGQNKSPRDIHNSRISLFYELQILFFQAPCRLLLILSLGFSIQSSRNLLA